jgi:hypothetical protein
MYKFLNYLPFYLLIILGFLFVFQGCQKKSNYNHVLEYLNNSQLKFDNKIQRDNVKEAMMDILTLDKQYLEERKYKDLEGSEGKWDLKMVIENHFIPNKPGLTLGDNFYDDVKSDSVMVYFGKLYMKY